MRLRLDAVAYRFPLATALATACGVLTERRGWITTLRDAGGVEGVGEVAPIYWIDDDPLSAAGSLLDRIRGALEVTSLQSANDVTVWLATVAARCPLRPCVRAGLETAALDLVARRRGCSVASLLGEPVADVVAMSALVSAVGAGDVERAVADQVGRGVRSLKLKVGGLELEQDVERIQAAIRALRDGTTLRIDANCAWTFEQARFVLGSVRASAIDYVEEPLRDPDVESSSRLRAQTGCTIAIDESLERLGGVDAVAGSGAFGVVIVKPARAGGPLAALGLARAALARGLRCVFTDAIETDVGQAAVVHAAAALGSASEAVGLGGRTLTPSGDAAAASQGLGPNCIAASACGPGLSVQAIAPARSR